MYVCVYIYMYATVIQKRPARKQLRPKKKCKLNLTPQTLPLHLKPRTRSCKTTTSRIHAYTYFCIHSYVYICIYMYITYIYV